MSSELRKGYHDDLADLHQRVVGMGRVVASGVPDATRALLTGDSALADRVIAGDTAIDRAYPSVEAEVFDIVARQAPVARDLRFVISTFRIAANVERCGDLVASIARRVERLDGGALDPGVGTIVEEMGGAVAEVFERAMQAYSVLDAELASTVAELDDRIDDLQRRLLRVLVAQPSDVEFAIELALVARFYERIGDHAVVIAERVRFVALGEMDPGDRDEQ